MEGLYEGVTTVTDAEEVDYSSPLYNPEGEDGEASSDGKALEGGEMPLDEGMMEDTKLPEMPDMMESIESSDEEDPSDGELMEEGTSDGDGENEADTNEGQDSEQEPEG